MPSSLCARFSPSSCDWLNERSLNLPMSLTSAAVKFELLPPPDVDVVFLPLEPPQPAVRSTAATTPLSTPTLTGSFLAKQRADLGPALRFLTFAGRYLSLTGIFSVPLMILVLI